MRHLLQQLVAHFMAERVVEHLELVQVQEQQRPGPAFARSQHRGLGQAVQQQAAIGQAGQRIVEGQAFDLGRGQPDIGDIVVGDDHAALGSRARRHLHETAAGQLLLHGDARTQHQLPVQVLRLIDLLRRRHQTHGAGAGIQQGLQGPAGLQLIRMPWKHLLVAAIPAQHALL